MHGNEMLRDIMLQDTFPLAMGNQSQALLNPGQMQTLPRGQSLPDGEGKHDFLPRKPWKPKS